MSADSFHHQVQMSLNKTKKIYDFTDFKDCMQRAISSKVTVKNMVLTVHDLPLKIEFTLNVFVIL
jgi:hypothetical protein